MPYSPMHSEPLAGPEKQAQMLAKLAARAKISEPQRRGDNRDVSAERCTVATSQGRLDDMCAESGPREDARTPAGNSIASPRSPLVWLDPVKMGHGSAMQHTQCGRFRIDALKGRNTIDFTAWAIRATPEGLNDKLGVVDSGPQARALCEAHYASRPIVGAEL